MRRTGFVPTATILSLALAATVSAQTRPSTDPASPRQDTTRSEPQRQAWAPDSTAVESSKLIGVKVKNNQGKDVGEIDQLIIDQSDGRVTHVVVGKGGVLGIGEQKVVLPWSDVKTQPDPTNRLRMVVMVDQGKLDSAPRYEARRDTTPAASPATPSSTSQPRQDKKN